MTDFAKLIGWREPEEIYLAAVGNPKPLSNYILTNPKFTELERRTLAAFVRGELRHPKRRRGQKRISYLPTLDDAYESILSNAVLDYHWIMTKVEEEQGSKHRVKFDCVEYISQRDGLNFEALLNRINRPTKGQTNQNEIEVPHAVKQFHRWLHRTGRLSDYPPYYGGVAAMSAAIMGKRMLESDPEELDQNDHIK